MEVVDAEATTADTVVMAEVEEPTSRRTSVLAVEEDTQAITQAKRRGEEHHGECP